MMADEATSAPCTCPACGHPHSTIAATWEDWVAACGRRPDGPMRLTAADAAGVAQQAPVLRTCENCRSVFMDPLPRDEQLTAFYTNYHATDEYARKASKKVNRALKRLLPFRLLSGGGRFLEVGASIGTAAEAARRLGFKDPIAQEIDADAVKAGRALFPRVHFAEGPLDRVTTSPAFSMMYCAEVIEHVPDPRAFATLMFERLSPGGYLFITTPDVGHTKRPKDLMEWGSVKPPEHITLFTKDGLRALMTAAGFSSVTFFPHPKTGIRMMARRAKA